MRRFVVAGRVILTIQAFMRVEAAGGIFLLVGTITALAWANSPWANSYQEAWHTAVTLEFAGLSTHFDLRHAVNDGLMAIFFLLVGLEIKRELAEGELSSLNRAMLPALAALGGMVAPALIYLAFNAGGQGASGWGVPMATDIAFALGVLSLLGSRVPLGAKVFLLALAIADDIGAIVVIAFFYSADLDPIGALAAIALIGLLAAMNRSGVESLAAYVLLGIALWFAVLEAGIHATLAGVLLGLLIPARERPGATKLAPLDRLEAWIHPWVSYLIVPVFALANAGVAVSPALINDAASSPCTLGIMLGLVVGKPVGICGATWLACRLGVCKLPSGTSQLHIFGVGVLGGIGFTVSLLIIDLAFGDASLTDEAKVGVLGASLLAAVAGLLFLRLLPAENPNKGQG